MSEGRVVVGHPVDVGSGAVYTLSTDFRLPGALEIGWTRYYSTAALADTWLGPKWSVPYFMVLERHSDRYVLIGAHGEEVTFVAPIVPLPEGPPLVNMNAKMELRREGEQYRILHWHTGGPTRRFCFQASDDKRTPLAAIENLAGLRIRVEYDKRGRPNRLVQELERRTLEISYDDQSLIGAIHFVAGTQRKLQVQYEYDEKRRLIAAKDALGHVKSYEYDRENRMIAETDPLNSRFVFEYDRQGRCIHTTGPDGFMERHLKYRSMPRMTRVTDTRGAVTDYYLNPAGQVLQIVFPLGAVTTNVFDEHGRLVKVIQSDLSKETYEYDERGDRCATVDPCGGKTTVKHNDGHLPIRMVDRNGTAWKLDQQ
jgi:YD repeat-containing protein